MRGRPIPGLKRYQGRNPDGYFEDLPPELKREANHRLWHLCQKWNGNLPPWRFAILVGQAKQLTLHPRGYEWSRWMNAKKGGYAVQRKYRAEDRHPTQKATQVRLAKQKQKREAERRRQLGLPPPTRHRFLPLD